VAVVLVVVANERTPQNRKSVFERGCDQHRPTLCCLL
jgi:hypothetical protein